MGLIRLYSATSTSFDDNGTPLVTAREAVVKRDEGFQLTFSIPISQNELHKRVQKEMIVSAMTPDGVNYFRIWDIDKRTTDVKVTALQLLYSLDVKQINPFGGKQYTGDSVLRAFVNSFKSSISPYTFSSSIVTQRDFYTNEEDDTSTSHNALAILNKITDNWSGELMLNGFDVRMISKLGTKTDALLYEHKNIASFSDSSSMNGIVTRIYATATYTPERAEGATEDPEPVVLTATVDSPLINQYAVIYEATMEYNDARTVDELRAEILKQYSEFNVDKPERTIDVDTNIVDGTAINFGDELVLKYLVHDVDEIIRCVGYEYDPISENYIGVTLGTLEKTFLTKVTEGISSSVSSQLDKINRDIQSVQTAANGKNRVTYGPNPVPNAIEGDLWFYHPEGRPDEVEIRVYQNGLWIPAPFLTDQDKAQFEQEMADHYDAALAEVERKDAEYKEIFDDYDEKVLAIDQGIADAATKAQSALEEAGISTDLAQTAKDLATTVQTNASTAITMMENDFVVFKNSYQSTVNAINTELSKTAKTTDLNGMVTETTLATKQFVTAGSMNTTLSNYAQVNNVPTNTQFNTLKNSYDSMVQTIGTNGSNIAQMVMTDRLFSTTVRGSISVGGVNLVRHERLGPYPSYNTTPVKNLRDISFKKNNDRGFTAISQWGIPYGANVTLTLSGIAKIDGVPVTNSTWGSYRGASTFQGRISHFSIDDATGRFVITQDWTDEGGGWLLHGAIFTTPINSVITISDFQVEQGNIPSAYSPAPEDKADQSQVTQLAGSWALTLKSGNDIKTQINASTDSIRLASKFIHLSGQTLIDDAVIKSAHIDTLNANKIVGNTAEFNTIRAGVLTVDAVRASHIYADTVLFDKLFSNTMSTDRLAAREAWIKSANIIGINADKITAGTISADRISTSSLTNVAIGGRNLILNSQNVHTMPNGTGLGNAVLMHDESTPYYRVTGISTISTFGFDGNATSDIFSEPMIDGATYTVSVDVRVFHTGSVGFYAGRGMQTISKAHEWVRIKHTYTYIGTSFRVLGLTYDKSVMDYRNWKIEKGNKETDWIPASEDIVNKLKTSGQVVIHGGNIQADTLDVGAITGNKATFISTGFKSLNSQSTINAHAIRIQNTAGEFVEMNNTPELRSDDAGGTAVVLGKGRVHFYDSRGHSKGYVGVDMHTAGSHDFGTFLSKGSGIYKFARMADATQTTYAYYTVKAGHTAPSSVITDMVINGYLPDGNAQQFVAKGNMISELNGWPNYPNWPTLTAGQQIRYKELTSQTTGDAYEDIWKFGPSSQGDWRIYFAKHATFSGGTTGTSDRRLKHDIETTQIEALGHIESLEFKEFRWNRDNKYEPLGLIAQDSGIVRVADDDMEGIDIQRAIMLGLKGVQELQEIVKEQATEIKQLKEIINQ